MKTNFFSVLIICIFANHFSAQTLIKPADFKLSNVATLLSNKGYQILEQEEKFIKISTAENATLFIDVDPDKKYLHFNVKILMKKTAKKDQIDLLLKKINKLAMIKAEYLSEDNSVFFQYYFWMAKGFTNETLEDAVTEFFLYQGDSYGIDTEKIIDYAE